MSFYITRQDITGMKVDAIVNAANRQLLMGGGVCGSIFRAAGATRMQEACRKLSPINTGEAVVTPGFSLWCKHVIHTAGPVYQGGSQGEREKLALCYENSMKRAMEYHCASMAFPLISSGIYGYPKEEALDVAVTEIRSFLADHPLEVYLVLFDQFTWEAGRKRMGE